MAGLHRRARSQIPLTIRGGDVVTPSGVRRADIVIEAGRIAAVLDAGDAARGGRDIDATGLVVLPGMIDPHVHFDEPGRTDWEGFASGSAAAAAGGVTTVVDMPIDCDPPTTTAEAVAAKVAAVEAHSVIDVAMWGGLVPESVGELGAMLGAGVVGFKAFACPSGWDDFPAADEATLRAGFAAGAAAGVPVAVHCELEPLGRTVASEVEAVRWAAGVAAHATSPVRSGNQPSSTPAGLRPAARLHVVHVSSAETVDEARRWPGVTVETCPHYLVLDDADAARIGPRARCFPPVRSADNREALWSRLLDGAVDVIASDHSPCPPGDRHGDQPWAGIDAIGLTLPVLLASERLSLPEIARLTTAGARILSLPGKGAIAPGFDADLVLLDPTAAWTVDGARLHTRHRASPYIGRRVRGEVITTLVRGEVVFADGSITRDHGGRALRRAS